jgi:hypothetical protein
MATKAELETLINTNLATSSLITATEHRAVEQSLLNSFYPTVTNVTQADTTIFTPNAAFAGTFLYEFNVVKIGRLITVTGYFVKNSLDNTTVREYFTITNPEYLGVVNDISFGGNSYLACNLNGWQWQNTTADGSIDSDQKFRFIGNSDSYQVHFQYFAQS